MAFRNPPKASFFSFLFKSTFLMFVPRLSWQMLSHLLYREEPRHTQKTHSAVFWAAGAFYAGRAGCRGLHAARTCERRW